MVDQQVITIEELGESQPLVQPQPRTSGTITGDYYYGSSSTSTVGISQRPGACSGPLPEVSPATVGGLFFALGMTWLATTEFVVLMKPQILPYIYVSQIYILFLPSSDWLFIVNFGLCNGPVLTANIVYRCSMVLSDLQRFITWYMHVMPAVVMFTLRWLPYDAKFEVCQGPLSCLSGTHPILILVLPVIAFLAHAIAYNTYVWKLCPSATRNHPQYENSYLYHAKKCTSGALLWMLNCLGPRYRLLSFTMWNALINFVSVVIAYCLWSSMIANLVYLLTVIFATAFYAGTWYCYVTTKNTSVTTKVKTIPTKTQGELPITSDQRSPDLPLSPIAAS